MTRPLHKNHVGPIPDRAPLNLSPAPSTARPVAAIAIVGLVLCGLFLHVSEWNLKLLLWMRAFDGFSDELWMCITVLGTGWVSVLVVSMVDRRGSVCSVAAFMALVLGGLLVTSIKHFAPTPRPLSVLGAESMHVIGQHLTGANSMPSGHTLSAMAAVAVIILFLRARFPRHAVLILLPLAIGLLVSWSRVAVGAHWPADVLVGAGLGVAVGCLCWYGSVQRQNRQGALSQKFPIFFELLVVCYAPFERNAYPAAQPLLWFIAALAVISILFRIYNLHRASANHVRVC